MIPSRLSRRLLALLFIRQQNTETIDFIDLCAGVRARPYAVLKALRALGSAGLVDPSRLRLTLSGRASQSFWHAQDAALASGEGVAVVEAFEMSF